MPAFKKTGECWWDFVETEPGAAGTGEFIAVHTEQVARLYFPLVNEAGMRSWTNPDLQGSPAAEHNEYLGVPLTAEDLAHTLVHRGFWLAEPGRRPFSLSRLSADGLDVHARRLRVPATLVNAGPGWFSVVKESPDRRFRVRATLWCPSDLDEKIEIMLVEVTNTSKKALHFDAYGAIPLFARSADDVRDHRHVTALLNRVRLSRHGVSACPTMSFDERGHRLNTTVYTVLGFGPRGRPPTGIWPTQESFLGEGGSFAAPAAVWRREKEPRGSPASFQGKEALGGFCFEGVVLRPGESGHFVFLGGVSDSAACVARWTRWARSSGNVRSSLECTREHWLAQTRGVSFRTPFPRLNNWLAWVGTQPTLRRLYGNSYLPQYDYGRGGKGWRDLWQDCLALLLSDPSGVKRMLLHNFGGVRMDGSNATIIGTNGSFIADRNSIPRTWMDHGCWPAYTTLLYVDQTGDLPFLLREREYFRDPQTHRCKRRDARWTEAYGRELRARDGRVYRGTIFEHMLVQNLTAFFNVGEHNVCLLEGADWNDGLDMADDRGESVAFAAFYAWNLDRLADLADVLARRGNRTIRLARELRLLLDRAVGGRRVNYSSSRARQARLKAYLDVVARDVSGRTIAVDAASLAADLREKSRTLAARIREEEWVALGKREGLFNGYYDNRGRRVEGRRARGVRMTLTGQVFPLMAGIAEPRQVEQVVRSVDRWLKDPVTGGVRLNTDFGGIQPDLGRAFSFAYGEKENGAVFCHMAVMYAYALYRLRRPDVGHKVWSALYGAATNSAVACVFPCVPEYFNAEGRGMYCYLTGTASWMVYLLLTQAFGVRGELGDLVVDPQLLPHEFGARGECSVKVPFAGRSLEVVFHNPRRLKPGQYKVMGVRAGGRAVPCEPREQGGVLIRRRELSRLPAGRTIRLDVTL